MGKSSSEGSPNQAINVHGVTRDDGEEPLAGMPCQPNAARIELTVAWSPFALTIHDRDLLCLHVNNHMCQIYRLR